METKTLTDLKIDRMLKTAVLTELFNLGIVAYKLNNSEMQSVLTESISTAKGELAEIERTINELKNIQEPIAATA